MDEQEEDDDVYTCGVCLAKIHFNDLTNHVFLHDDYTAFSYDETTKIIEPITEAVKNNLVNIEVEQLQDDPSQAYNLATTASALVDLGSIPDAQQSSEDLTILYEPTSQPCDTPAMVSLTSAEIKPLQLTNTSSITEIPISEFSNYNIHLTTNSQITSLSQDSLSGSSQTSSLVGLQLNPSDDQAVQYIAIQKPGKPYSSDQQTRSTAASSSLASYLTGTAKPRQTSQSHLTTLNEIFVWNKGKSPSPGETVMHVQAPIIENGASRMAECAVVFVRFIDDKDTPKKARTIKMQLGVRGNMYEEVQNVDGLEEIDVGSLMDSSSLSYRRKIGSTKSGKTGRQMDNYKYRETGISESIAKELRKTMVKDSPAIARYLQSMNIPIDDVQELEDLAAQQQNQSQQGPQSGGEMVDVAPNGMGLAQTQTEERYIRGEANLVMSEAVNALVAAADQMENAAVSKEGSVYEGMQVDENQEEFITVDPIEESANVHNKDIKQSTETTDGLGKGEGAYNEDETRIDEPANANMESEYQTESVNLNAVYQEAPAVTEINTCDTEEPSSQGQVGENELEPSMGEKKNIKQEQFDAAFVRQSSRLQEKKATMVCAAITPKTKVVRIKIKAKAKQDIDGVDMAGDKQSVDIDSLGKKYGYFCSICNKKLPPETVLKEHLESHRIAKKKSTSTVETVMKSDVMSQENKLFLFYCSLCNKMFPSEEDLKEHCLQHKADGAGQDDDEDEDRQKAMSVWKHNAASVKRPAQSQPLRTVKKPKEQLPCNFCGRVLNSKSSWYQHKRTHEKEEDDTFNRCPRGCGQKFKSQMEVDLHGPFCIRNNDRPQTKTSDDEVAGTSEEMKCPYCNLLFETKANVHFHSLVCSERPWEKCPKCDFTCKGTLPMSKHQVKVHNMKPFKCDECGKDFRLKGSLRDHVMSVHNSEKYECEHCGKKFTKNNIFKRHMFVQHGGFRYPCNYCHKKFKDKRCWRVHENSHKGAYEYSCLQCKMSFSKTQDYKDHMLEVHSIVPQEALALNKQAKELRLKLCKIACRICKERFPLETAFLHHLQKIHEMSYEDAFDEFNKVCPEGYYALM